MRQPLGFFMLSGIVALRGRERRCNRRSEARKVL